MDHNPTRRDCAKALLALTANPALATPPARELALQNPSVRFTIELADRKVEALHFTDRLNQSEIDLPPAHFELEFDDGRTVDPAGLDVATATAAANHIELIYAAEAHDVEVRIRYTLPPCSAYLRKQISVRRPSAAAPSRLIRATLDNWRGVRRNWSSMRQDALPYGSHPIFCDHLWAGVEFVAAFNTYDSGGFVLQSRPGGRPVQTDWVDLRSTVTGVAPRGAVRDAFLRYIDDIRLAPPRWVACYNSWWTLPLLVKQDDYLALMRTLKEKLFDTHGVFFDFVATDAGWNDRQSIWQIDRKNLPHGFDDVRALAEAAGAQPGLWMSPGEEYPDFFDYDWARRQGYSVLINSQSRMWSWTKGVSIADPKYREETKTQLRTLIRENHFGHMKYDGLVAYETAPHHDLLPGVDSVEPIAEYSLELMQASKRADPRLYTEPTYLNSLANYISPWIIRYSDSVWGNSGGDCPPGLTPAPDYREAHTSAREYFIFSSLDEIWLPQNALQYFDIIHCDDDPGFPNHAAMAVGRGRFFLSTYLNPKYLSPDDWRIYAGLLQWARRNQDILANTKVLPSRVELGEPYAYAHWLGRRGIVAVRNPSNETRPYTLNLRESGAPASLSGAVCYTQYPYRMGIAAGLHGASHIDLQLGPWELLFLEIVPRADLKEPIVIGARWFADPGGISVAASPHPVDPVWLEPGGRERKLSLPHRTVEPLAAEVTRRLAFEMECEVQIPAGAQGTVLFLVQFPGRKHRPSRATIFVNGASVPVRQRPSANHVGSHITTETSYWKAAMQYESEWTWYLADLSAGKSIVRIEGVAEDPNARLGAWAWCERDVKATATTIQAPSSDPAMPQYRDTFERQGICLQKPTA